MAMTLLAVEETTLVMMTSVAAMLSIAKYDRLLTSMNTRVFKNYLNRNGKDMALVAFTAMKQNP